MRSGSPALMGGMTEPMPQPGNPYQEVQPLSPSDEKMWATLVHIGGIFFGFIPALIGYLVLKDRGPLVRQHTGSALNFQLTMLIAYGVGLLLLIVFIGFLIVMAVSVVVIIFSILAAVAANKGEYYQYPLAFKFIK